MPRGVRRREVVEPRLFKAAEPASGGLSELHTAGHALIGGAVHALRHEIGSRLAGDRG